MGTEKTTKQGNSVSDANPAEDTCNPADAVDERREGQPAITG